VSLVLLCCEDVVAPVIDISLDPVAVSIPKLIVSKTN